MQTRSVRLLTLSLLLLLMIVSPTWAAAKKKPGKKVPPAPALVIHTHTADNDSFKVNSYLLETRTSVILIDTQMTTTEAQMIKGMLTTIGKPLAAIFITHPHPDHYNNIALFQSPKVPIPVYATAATIASMKEQDPALRAYWDRFYPGKYPSKLTLPTHPVKAGDQLTIGGLHVQIDEVVGGEAESTLLIALPASNALFVGDLVYSGVHPNMREGQTKQWLANLQTVRNRYPDVATVYPGHGVSGSRELLTAQEAYLTTVRSQIRSRLKLQDPRLPFDDISRQVVGSTLLKTYDYAATLNLEISLDKVVEELLREAGYKPAVEEDDEE